MITIPRTAVRAFRNVLRSCLTPRRRAPAPPVLLQSDGKTVSLTAEIGEITLRWTTLFKCGQGTWLLPPGLIDEIEGAAGDVAFDRSAKEQAVVCWSDRGAAREREFTPHAEASAPTPPPLPKRWSAAPPALLAALNEAARLAARADSGRYALHRVQIRGGPGEVIGTDGRRAQIRSGWTFPFAEAVLVPAVPVFASGEFHELPARVGRTASHLAFVLGPWTLWLRLDNEAKYPDVRSAVPDPREATIITLGEEDVARLGKMRPGRDPSPVTIVGEESNVAIMVPREEGNEPATFALSASTVSGPPVRLALDRRDLLRAIASGCRRLELFAAGRPWAALGAGAVYLANSLDPTEVVPPAEPIHSAALVPVTSTAVPSLRESSHGGVLDEAEDLRRSLHDSGRMAGRLLGRIVTRLKEERILERLWTAVKSLPPAGGSQR